MRLAAQLWATARQQGRPAADVQAPDGDVILAAQTQILITNGHDAVVATGNPRHLARFVPAEQWQASTMGFSGNAQGKGLWSTARLSQCGCCPWMPGRASHASGCNTIAPKAIALTVRRHLEMVEVTGVEPAVCTLVPSERARRRGAWTIRSSARRT
jgi:hypothetical protein